MVCKIDKDRPGRHSPEVNIPAARSKDVGVAAEGVLQTRAYKHKNNNDSWIDFFVIISNDLTGIVKETKMEPFLLTYRKIVFHTFSIWNLSVKGPSNYWQLIKHLQYYKTHTNHWKHITNYDYPKKFKLAIMGENIWLKKKRLKKIWRV